MHKNPSNWATTLFIRSDYTWQAVLLTRTTNQVRKYRWLLDPTILERLYYASGSDNQIRNCNRKSLSQTDSKLMDFCSAEMCSGEKTSLCKRRRKKKKENEWNLSSVMNQTEKSPKYVPLQSTRITFISEDFRRIRFGWTNLEGSQPQMYCWLISTWFSIRQLMNRDFALPKPQGSCYRQLKWIVGKWATGCLSICVSIFSSAVLPS